MTRTRKTVFFILLVFSAFSLFGQTGVSLGAEIQNLERIISTQGIASSQRHSALVSLARLHQLSGNLESAARAWLEAAAAIPGSEDDDALLACAYCLAGMGEWERARTALEPLLPKSARARFLYLSIDSITSGNTYALEAIAEDSAYSEMKSEIYYLLYRTSRGPASERFRQRLLAEFPESPEAALLNSNGLPAAVMIRPGPFWFFLGGLDTLLLAAAEAPGVQRQSAQTAVSVQPAPGSAAVQTQDAQQQRLQTGLYSRQENAQAQLAALRQAGFSPIIEQRGSAWAVVVPAGADAGRTLAELRNAGFDAFPLR